MSEAALNPRQSKMLEMLRTQPRRDLYEGAAAPGGKYGSGRFWVTYSADESYEPIGWDEVRDMERRGLIVEQWPGCYCLPDALREPAVRKFGRR